MLGLEIDKVKAVPSQESNEYTVRLTLKKISDEGLDVFGLTEDDVQA